MLFFEEKNILSEKKKVLLILPAYNEEESIEKSVGMIIKFRQEHQLEYDLDYVVINDGSKDRTAEILNEQNFNHVDLIKNLGIGGAVQTGYMYARDHGFDIAVQFDGDGQHDINSLDKIVLPLVRDEYDLVIGSRFIEKKDGNFTSTFMRRLGSNIISFFIKLVCGKKIYDTTSGFRAANRQVIEYFAKRYPISYPEPESIVHLVKKKYRIGEKSVQMFEREGGESSISAYKSVTYMVDVIVSIIISGFMKEED
jgi:glycosyltransferase involved in cell wall biosynthesis